MYRSRTARSVLLVLSVTLVAASCGSRDSGGGNSNAGGGGGNGSNTIDTANCPDSATAGISGGTITLASSFPQSGLTAAFAQISKGYKAYFAAQNDKGGVSVAGKKYQIKVVDKDDEYTASKTATNINSLVGDTGTKAFAVFNVVGTANNVAIRDDLGTNCVPNIFAATGSPITGDPNHPWMIGSTLAPYTLEIKTYVDYLKKQKPNAKVAMLLQDDDFGQAYKEGFTQAIKGTKITLAQSKTYQAGADDVSSQMTSLAATKADAFIDGATLLACPNALKAAKTSGWNPITFVSGTCISKTLMGIAGADGDKVLSATNIKDPQNPAYANDAAMKDYRALLAKFGAKDVDPDNGIVAYGYTQAAIFVKVLEGLKTLDRPTLMDAMHAISPMTDVGLLVAGVEVHTAADDPYLAEDVQMVQYDAKGSHFVNVGDVIDYEGKTAQFTPKDLISG
ncbi:MAG: branched-chain amino acid transporter substrate-binding protein [Acidimicrobiales bacterium]|nr:branched-chain amino acid transporter substrate-binding protein [Acidimicrobiales bacterium]